MLFFLISVVCFGQAGALRDYVGLISIRYHSDVVSYMGKFRESFEKKGYTNAAKSIDNYLKGLSGSGFIYVHPDGNCYVLTNEHVVSQADSLSITFEKLDGAKTTYDRLKVLFVDEEKDLAILTFDAGIKPFTQSLSFSAKPADEGGDVFAAGFPGLGNTAIWQFSRGNVSNAAARIPKSFDSDEIHGPYIQHTAQVDPGNSGGPLLVEAQRVPTGYAVVGINTLSVRGRQATNYAIPIDQVNTFIAAALSKEPVNERQMVSRKVDEFIKGLGANKTVYDHIAAFLSTACTASNAEYAISELLDKGSRTILTDIDRTFTNDPVEGMSAAVGWIIENSMRSGSGGVLKVSLESINPNDKGGFNVALNVNGKIAQSEWINEYGIFRLDTYGDIATGNKSLLGEKQKKKEQDKALRTDYNFFINAGYAYVLDYGSAIHAAVRIWSPFYFGFELFYGFGDDEYFQAGMMFGINYPVRLNTFAIMPFGELGMGYISTKASKSSSGAWGDSGFDFAVPLTLKGGLMFTTSAMPGLFGQVFYHHSIPVMKDKNEVIKGHGTVGVGIGYGF